MTARPIRLPSIAALTDPDALRAIAGPVRAVAVEPLAGVGFSSAALSRVSVTLKSGGEQRYVLKCTSLGDDWMAVRSRDLTGREAQLIGDGQFAGVWDVFDSPYVAFAAEPDRTGLLMTDLTPHLLPDVRAPLSADHEEALLGALAALHARFWNSPVLDREWLVPPAGYCDMLGPAVAGDASEIATLSAHLQQGVPAGWRSAMPRLGGAAAARLTCTGGEHQRAW